MPRQPALFVSHGAPDIAVKRSPAHDHLLVLGRVLARSRPAAVLAISAHWETAEPTVSTKPEPATMYDFGGFDPRLYQIRYTAPGAPDLARRAARLLAEAGLAAREDGSRDWDHGVWTPLVLLFPQAEVPVAQISIQPDRDAAHHYRIGRALAALRDEGVLILASGAMTHNLGAFFGRTSVPLGESEVRSFTDWMAARLIARDTAALLDYRKLAPYGVLNHPEDEHLLPLFVAYGAAADAEPVARIHDSIDRGVLAMDAYRFGA